MTTSRTTFSYFDRFLFGIIAQNYSSVQFQIKSFIVDTDKMKVCGFSGIISYIFEHFSQQKTQKLCTEGMAGGFMLAHFFTLQFCLKVMKVSIGH